MLAVLLAMLAAFPVTARANQPITNVFLDLASIHKWDDSNGDTWDPFWADDDLLYAFNCDGRGFGHGIKKRNMAFNKISGDTVRDLRGSLINSMDAYGKSAETKADGATWKALGQECIDSVFYAFISRHTYGNKSNDPWMRQTAVNASLIKSIDKGLTWQRTEDENYAQPMFPGSCFGAPYFFHFGKNGGQAKQDAAEQYVYAISTDGFWNDGDHYFLGRVPRRKIGNLNPADWTFFTGGDGADDAHWTGDLQKAAPVISQPHQCSVSAPCFIPALGRYLMVLDYNPEMMSKWYRPSEMKYDFWQAAHPWGPWTLIKSFSDDFLLHGHMYGPALCAKFQEQEGNDVRVILFHSGFPFADKPSALYKMWEIPVLLSTEPVAPFSVISADDERVRYTGQWSWSKVATTGPIGALKVTACRQSSEANDAVELEFTGTGIEYVARKQRGYGNAEVFLDGQPPTTVDLGLTNFPAMQHVVVFRRHDLPDAAHHLKIVARTADAISVEAFTVNH